MPVADESREWEPKTEERGQAPFSTNCAAYRPQRPIPIRLLSGCANRLKNNEEAAMYSDFKTISTYYDALYVKDAEYAPEAAKVKELLTRHGVPSQADLLILACGTGGHIPYFKDDYNVSGLDLSEDMLDVAKKKFPGQKFYLGNLIDFRLEADFDAMVCLYGSVGFVKTVGNLRACMKSIAAHLRPNGLALITPWSTAEDFQDLIVVDAIDRPDLKIARMEQVRLKEPKTVEVTFHHLLGKDNDVTYHKQSMEIGLFSREEYTSAMTDAGLQVVEEYTGTAVRGGAYIGKRVSDHLQSVG
jgi:SAM-dependent methyltransferase